MLEKIDLSRELAEAQYEQLIPQLQRRLYDLEKACWDAKIPTIIVFEGWDAAGKGTSINLLTSRLDPRGFKLYPIQAPRTYETHLPWLWRFWLKIPNYGEMAIFDRSWYGRVLVERVEGLTPMSEWSKGYRDIVDFERTLADDGCLIVKFFLHISQEEQKRRFKKLEGGMPVARAAISSGSPRGWIRAATKCIPSLPPRVKTRPTLTCGVSGAA